MPQYGVVDDRLDPSTPQRCTLPQTRLANIPARFFQEACEYLVNIIRPEYDDRRILRCLNIVRTIVQDVLKQDPKLKRHLADAVNFSIVSRAKEGKTLSNHCELWQRMSPGSVYSTTVHCSPVLGSNHSHCVPCPGVFMKPRRTAPGESNNSTFISRT